MSVCYLKAYGTTEMASGKDDFLYEDDQDAVLAMNDADILENDEDMESEIVTCITNLPSREKRFVRIRVLSKTFSIQSRFIKARESKTSTAQYP